MGWHDSRIYLCQTTEAWAPNLSYQKVFYYCKGPCKRTQHCWPTTPNIVGPNNVVTCCFRLHRTKTMLALVGICYVQLETGQTDYGQTVGTPSPNISIVLRPAKPAQQWNPNNVGLVKTSAHAPCNIFFQKTNNRSAFSSFWIVVNMAYVSSWVERII